LTNELLNNKQDELSLASEHHPIILCILDGWGISNDHEYNAISLAKTPFWNYLLQNFPHTEISTSGEIVGLPPKQMGNSEVGHMTIGSGRIILQDLLRINNAINDDSLAKHEIIQNLLETSKTTHLLALCSDGGVHSSIEHIIYLAKIIASKNIDVKLHLFTDGRDVSPKSAGKYLNYIDNLQQNFPNIKIATIAGRFYAMDRDQKWDRTKQAYEAIVNGLGNKINAWQDYLQEQYDKNITDEFIIPASFKDYHGLNDEDSIIFVNFRSDRIRQLAKSILYPDFKHFTNKMIKFKHQIGMTDYSDNLKKTLSILFPEEEVINSLGEIIAKSQKTQLRIAETEKYPHVTFFFNGGKENPYPNEDRILVSSPNVLTYDLQPEMSAYEMTKHLTTAITTKKYDLIIINYANADMVGHSGNLDAAIKAVEVIDHCLKEIYSSIKETDFTMLVTSDHGNVEYMFDKENNTVHTSHTTNPVPLVLVAKNLFQSKLKLEKGSLRDIAPTILELMHIKKPQEMTGKSLLIK